MPDLILLATGGAEAISSVFVREINTVRRFLFLFFSSAPSVNHIALALHASQLCLWLAELTHRCLLALLLRLLFLLLLDPSVRNRLTAAIIIIASSWRKLLAVSCIPHLPQANQINFSQIHSCSGVRSPSPTNSSSSSLEMKRSRRGMRSRPWRRRAVCPFTVSVKRRNLGGAKRQGSHLRCDLSEAGCSCGGDQGHR